MSAWRPSKCKRCGASKSADVPISKNGYCVPCGIDVAREAAIAMHTGTGEHRERFDANPRARMGRPRPRGVGGTS